VLSRWSAHAEAAHREHLEEARASMDAAAALRALNAGPVTVTAGPVADELAEAARVTDGRSPLLVLGRRTHQERGEGPGSIATRVLTLATSPVLMYLPDR
jgi:nucleotide-binding universal stress UspA family protein